MCGGSGIQPIWRDDTAVDEGAVLTPGGCSYRTRDGPPEGLFFDGLPDEASGRLNFKSGKIVVFEFGTQDEPQPIRNKLYLILNKCADQVEIPAVGYYGSREAVIEIIPDKPIAETPHHLVPCPQLKSMLKIDVKGILIDIQNLTGALQSVIVKLQNGL